MRRPTCDVEIDPDSLCGEETLNSRLSVIENRLYAYHNPYVGNKRKLIRDLVLTLEKHGVKYESILDIFSGSGAVSMAMKMLGKRVISNDILTSSYFNALAFVENNSVVLTEEEQKFLCTNRDFGKIPFNNPDDNRSHLYSHRFTKSEMDFLACYFCNLCHLFCHPAHVSFQSPLSECDYKVALAMVYLQNYIMDHCYVGGRLNHGQVLADVDHRLAHNRNKGHEMGFQRVFKSEPPFMNNGVKHQALNMDAIDLADRVFPEVDLCYIDPPYGGDQSDYAKMFQFFEEYIYQVPMKDMPHLANALRFTNSEEYEAHFIRLLELLSYVPCWTISYNDSSWGGIEIIVKCLKKFRTDVIVEKIDYTYKYSKKRKSTEYIIVARG